MFTSGGCSCILKNVWKDSIFYCWFFIHFRPLTHPHILVLPVNQLMRRWLIKVVYAQTVSWDLEIKILKHVNYCENTCKWVEQILVVEVYLGHAPKLPHWYFTAVCTSLISFLYSSLTKHISSFLCHLYI